MIFLAILGGSILVLFFGVVFIGAPYVPSKRRDLRTAFTRLYALKSSDFIVDIGSGDGVVLREAATYGTKGLGYEINPILVLVARMISRRQPRIAYVCANFWYVAFPAETTIVYTFGESRDIRRMAVKVEHEATRLGKPLFFMSYAVEVPGRVALDKQGAHYLYQIEPLQM